MHFYKMHGCSNDYIYFNCFKEEINNPNELAKVLANRHTGIGGDGIVLILPSDIADAEMRMFNLDGSEGMMCGNAIRCVATFLYLNKIVSKNVIRIATKSGIKVCELDIEDNKVKAVTVDMGKPSFDPKDIGMIYSSAFINKPLKVQNTKYNGTAVSMGNPHLVIVVDDVKSLNLAQLGPHFEHYPFFPTGVNTEFVKVINKNEIEMRVYERGSAETMACGTGACASVCALVINELLPKETWIKVHLLGGILEIFYGETVFLRGNAKLVFEGDYYED